MRKNQKEKPKIKTTVKVKELKDMPTYLKLSLFGQTDRGVYGFSRGMQEKMGKTIDVTVIDNPLMKSYDYIDNDGYCYRKEWLE